MQLAETNAKTVVSSNSDDVELESFLIGFRYIKSQFYVRVAYSFALLNPIIPFLCVIGFCAIGVWYLEYVTSGVS